MMKLLDIDRNPISEAEADVEKGYLTPTVIIKEGAAPVDNITKFAYEDGDYEEAMIYHRNPENSGELTYEERIAELEEALSMLLSGVTE